ncbi:ADP-ribosylglycohydrolase-domain-containing protein [Achaetomium macrosporum]|uniref:ADP-ribosylglycohydrolase-domain-containing protein n=1 Tax=Achaetomium macrosporum TaxID=79813 RepID=A0AAN7C2D6_9PEZI|nr:ADP-ribosylglycohydrolase-domain-containing protein [Achaetomium macrosporum]
MSSRPNLRPGHDHVPAHPSALRQTYTASSASSAEEETEPASPDTHGTSPAHRHVAGPSRQRPAETTPLLGAVLDLREQAHEGPCIHGTFSPRPTSPSSILTDPLSASESEAEASSPGIDGILSGRSQRRHGSWKRQLASKMRSKKMSTSRALAERHGIKDSALMYMSYYLPVLVWAREYNWSYFKGDFVAALTVAGMYVPMALSLADNLAHVPPLNGLYSFVFNPLVYALLGSSPAMIVGPEAAGSLLVGTVVKASVDRGHGADGDATMQARLCGIVSGMAGAMVFIAGVARLGFLDSVLSRPFLRGFISAIGVVVAVDQLIPELGLNRLANHAHINHASSVDKLAFIFKNLDKVHTLTFAVAATSFVIIMVCREIKRRLQPRYPGVAYIPDRFIVVVLSAFLAYWYQWDKAGVAVLGKVEAASGHLFTFRWPLQPSNMTYMREAMGTSFLIALLGFFESTVAAKSLGGQGFAGIQLSPNRELVALGTANIVGSCFMSLPAFGGYGRSKVNKSTGGRTPMSSIILSGLTLLCILVLLPYLYYLPKPVLSSLISVVAWSLIEECPHDVRFFVKIRAWQELALMTIIVLATIFFSLSFGMAIGVGLSLLQVIRHATRPRIQILGRVPGTNRFENAEADPDRLEFIEGCLIVKIPEPLTFANTGELKTRLRRLELYGTSMAHPALPRLRREDGDRNIIFDIHGVTSLDGSGAQVLEETVRDYRQRGVRIFFSRGPGRDSDVGRMLRRSGIVELAGGEHHFVDDVHEALKLTEAEEGGEPGVSGGGRSRCRCSTRSALGRKVELPPGPAIKPPEIMSNPAAPTRRDRVLGALLGVHAGDSLGATVEFEPWETIQRQYPQAVRDIIGGGHFGWDAGDATDDTDLTRAVLLAYRDVKKSKPTTTQTTSDDVIRLAAQHMLDWYDGRNWPRRVRGDTPRDVGGATATGLSKFKRTADPRRSGAGEGRAGNGSLMRCIPTALFQPDGERMLVESMGISAVTHDDFHCTLACAAYNAMVRALVVGRSVEEALVEGKRAVERAKVVAMALEEAKNGKIERAAQKVEEAIDAGKDKVRVRDLAENGPERAANAREVLPFKGSGYVLESLTLAVAAMMDPRPLEEVLVDVVRFGQDADTNGAIAGGLLGARDGVEAIPLRWRETLQFGSEFKVLVDYLLEESGN